MAEEKHPELSDEIGLDDQSVLRTLLHSIKGLSPVSVAAAFSETDDENA